MRWPRLILITALGLLVSCHHPKQPPVSPPVNYSYYHDQPFSWGAVSRVLVMPLENKTSFSHASDEVFNALTTELQQLGRFEVVAAPPDTCATASRFLHDNGRFNELFLIQLAREFRADVIVMGAVTQYSPYPPIRLGLSVQVVSPSDGLVVASVDGMWDSVNPWIAQRARDYYLQNCRRRDEPLTAELVLDSPRLYCRFVCFEVSHILVGDVLPGVVPLPPVGGPVAGEGPKPAGPGSPSAAPKTAPPPAPGLLPMPLPEDPREGPGASDPRMGPRPGSS
jgi:hypothetical protein